MSYHLPRSLVIFSIFFLCIILVRLFVLLKFNITNEFLNAELKAKMDKSKK